MKKLLLLFIFVAFTVFAFANPVNIVKAEQVAGNWIKGSQRNVTIFETKPIIKNGKTLWYFISLKPQGFILISADDAAYPILGYSYEHNFDYPIQSPEVKFWIEHYEKQLYDIIQNRLDNTPTIKFWQSLENGDLSFTKTERDVAPLLQTLWNQGQYYNEQCPYDENSTAGNNHVWAGCVATATAQVMKFWNYPPNGTGSHSYTENDYGTLSANFGATTYNWDNMPNSPSSVINDVTTLLYHIGVAVEMDYGPEGSGAWLSDAVSALETYFAYNTDAQMVWKSDYSTTDWENLLKGDLDNGRPILYRGQGSGGHAFVCDGYEGTNHFHFNWGWSGSANGYYYLNNLNPNGYDFNDYQGAGIHIYPNTDDFPPPTNLTASVSGTTVNLSWQAPSKALSSYKIYRNDTFLTSTDNTTYTDNGVSEGNRYTYYVTAVYTSPDGESGHSNSVNVALTLDLPYSTDFSSPSGWWQISESCSDRWTSSSTNNAGGSSPEMRAHWENENPATTRLVSPPLNTQNLSRLNISFKHFYDYYTSNDIAIKIQTSADGENWTDEVWIHNNPSANIGPETVTTYVTHNLGDVTYIAWVITGNLYNFDDWFVDDVSITVPPPTFSVSPIYIDFGNVEINSSLTRYFTISNTGYNNLTGEITTPSNFSVVESTRDGKIISKSFRNTLSYSIGAGSSKTYLITFSPTSETTYSGNVVITSNDPNHQTNNVQVLGQGVAAHVAVNPSSFSVTMETNKTEIRNLLIQNVGSADLTYTIEPKSVTYRNSINVYPNLISDWTGTTDGTTKTQHSLVQGYNTEDGWMKFDISSIPDGAIINSVTFHGYVNDAYWPYWSITPLTNDPVTTDAATLHSDIVEEASTGYYAYNNEEQSFSTGWHSYTLEGNINTDLRQALQNDWFAVGIVSRDNSTQYYIKFDGWNETNKPYLTVDYTIEVPWLKINDTYSYSGTINANGSENLSIGFDTSGMSNGTYNAKLQITSNDPYSPFDIQVELIVQDLPIISITPQNIDFGDVYIGFPETHQFTIQNTGHATLSGQINLLTDYHIVSSSKDETYNFTIPATSSTTFNLQLDPSQTGNYDGTIIITSNASNSSEETLNVTATAKTYAIMNVSTDSLYFGEVLLGNYSSAYFTISNTGDENLSGIINPPSEFYVYENNSLKGKPTYRDTLSFNISSGENQQYIVYFYPNSTGEKDGIITFTENDPYHENFQIKVNGTGYLNPPQNVTITIDGAHVVLNWDYNDKVSTYHVYSSDNPNTGFVQEGTIPRPPFTILNGANNAFKKFYKVTAE